MNSANHRIIFMGSGEFAAIILKKLLESNFKPTAFITQPDKPIGRRQTLSPSPAKKVASKAGLKIYEPPALKNIEAEELIKSLGPDLIVAADYGKIIPKNILDIPKFGALNVHPSLLPKYRGPSPAQNTILNGELETGVTIILMDELADHGQIVAISNFQFPISKMTYAELSHKLADSGGNLLLKTLPRWFKGEIKPVAQDESQATYTKILTREDGKINWQKSAEEIERQIRAFEKWPGSWCEWPINGKILKIKILKSEILSGEPSEKTPGAVFITNGETMAVSCGYGSLNIKELQLEGKNKIMSREFLRGYPRIVGAVLK